MFGAFPYSSSMQELLCELTKQFNVYAELMKRNLTGNGISYRQCFPTSNTIFRLNVHPPQGFVTVLVQGYVCRISGPPLDLTVPLGSFYVWRVLKRKQCLAKRWSNTLLTSTPSEQELFHRWCHCRLCLLSRNDTLVTISRPLQWCLSLAQFGMLLTELSVKRYFIQPDILSRRIQL